MKIRKERIQERAAISELIQEAFAGAEHSDGTEAELAAALWNGTAFIPELSLIAEQDGELAGYILFTKAEVGGQTVLALAPLAVKPKFQRQGIGTALLRHGHETAQKLGYSYSLVLGDPAYYGKEGYVPAEPLGVIIPADFPAEYFLLRQLQKEAAPISGAVRYAPEFGI